jgi:exonuclease SbcC
MAKRRYQFKSLKLHRSPGFPSDPFGRFDGFAQGLNILYGPNGVGKTTLVRLMRALLYQTKESASFEGEAILSHGETDYSLKLENKRLEQRVSTTGALIQLPGRNDELSDAYWLGLHDLLSAEGDNELFAQRIQTEMQGGIDLARAAKDADAIKEFSTRRGQIRAEREAKTAFEERRRIVAQTSELFDKLKELNDEIAQAQDVQSRHALITQALNYKEIEGRIAALEAEIGAYDPRLANMSSFTIREAKSIRENYDKALDDVRSVETEIKEATEALERADFDKAWLGDLTIVELIRSRVREIAEQVHAVQNAQKESAEAKASLASYEAELSFLVDQIPEHDVLKELLDQMVGLSIKSEPLRTTLEAKNQALALLGKPVHTADQVVNQLDTLRSLVVDAIKEAGKGAGGSPSGKRWLMVLALALSAIVALISIKFSPLIYISALLSAVVALALLFTGKTGDEAHKSVVSTNTIKKIRDHIGEFTLVDESLNSLVSLLDQIIGKLKTIDEQKRHNSAIEQMREQVAEAQNRYDTWRNEYQASAQKLNLSEHPDLERSSFYNASDILFEWVKAHQTYQSRAALLHAEESRLQELTAKLSEMCSYPPEGEIDALLIKADALADQIKSLSEISANLPKQQERLIRAQEELQRYEEAGKAFYEELSTPLWEVGELERLAEKIEEYQQKVSDLRLHIGALAAFGEATVQLASEMEAHLLESEQKSLTEQLDRLDEVREKRGTTQEQYDQATKSDALEKAEAAWADAYSELETLRKEEVEGRFIFELAKIIQQESQSHHQPEILRRASSWLERITHNQYSLGIGDDEFVARSSTNGQPYTLDQLSSGTRVQLLFAIRMAFLEYLERESDHHYPLFFDELMANSDDERSLAIAQAIGEIVTERQVFYATAQADEVGKLKEVVGEEVRVIDLGALVIGHRQTKTPFKAVSIPTIEVPKPIDDYDEYATVLGVAGPDLFAPIGEIHSWYLLTDSKALHGLLKRTFMTAGQAARSSAQLQQRLQLLKRVQELAQVGRQRPLSRYDLVDLPSEVNTNTQAFQAIQGFLEEENRTGNDLVQAIEDGQIKQFREPSKSALLDWLYEEGWATDAKPYDLQEIIAHMMLEFTDLQIDSEESLVIQRYLSSLLN